MKNFSNLFLLSFTILFISCEKLNLRKNEWKKPVDVDFKFDVKETASSNNNIVFNGGYIVLSEFEFDGKRVQGDDVYFNKPFNGGLKVEFNSNKVISELDFDIPQGTYTKIDIEFQAEGDTDKSIVVTGNYTNSSGDTYPLKLEIEELEIFTSVAKDSDGKTEIILDTNIPSTALIELNPVYWIQNISKNHLDNATTTLVDGVETILINGEINEDIYDIIDDQIDKGTEVVFN